MIRAHDEAAVLTIDVEGPATLLESPAVYAAACEQLQRGVRDIRIDLRNCTSMDSTFTGTLLSLHKRLEGMGGKLTLISPSSRVLELLAQMGLEDFYRIELRAPANGTSRVIPLPATEVAVLTQLVRSAHEELACVPGPAAAAFRAVAEELRQSEPPSSAPSSAH